MDLDGPDDGPRLRLLRVAAPMLAGFFQEAGCAIPYAIDDNPLPADARIVDVEMDAPTEVVVLTIESDAFEPVPEGGPIPDHGDVRFRCRGVAVKATEAGASRN